MNPIVQTKITGAVQSLQEPEPKFVTKAGAMQIDRQGSGDVQTVELGKSRPADPKKLDGNISLDAFDKLW